MSAESPVTGATARRAAQAPTPHLSTADLALLAVLTLAWGLNWPLMKAGIRDLPPMYFRAICLGGGLMTLWAYARLRGVSLAVPEGAWPDIVRLAIPNLIVWHVVMIIALKMLPAGRSALLGYTFPTWAVLAGLVFFGERVRLLHWLGIGAALAGTVLLLWSEFENFAGRPLGTGLMLLAAASWGYGTHLYRRHLTAMATLPLTFWMLALTLIVLVVLTTLFEHAQWRAPTLREWGAIAYNMWVAIAFCHVAWAVLARRLPPAASSLSVMMIPVVGVFSSAWLLGERQQPTDYAALILILVALSTVVVGNRRVGAAPRASRRSA
ncbi:MAG TPA: DMT family transporter [Burkholderiaceae bacterium]|nr:DMT family transporter [Burkholderiaceae bacterium]